MSNRRKWIAIAVVVAVGIVAVYFGGGWMWKMLLAMHGRH